MERVPEPFSDIEWMLKNAQASIPVMAEALLVEYGNRLAQVTLAIFMNVPAARRAAEEGLARAIARAPLEWDGLDLKTWLVGQVVQASLRLLSQQPVPPKTLIRFLKEDPISPATRAEIQLWLALGNLQLQDRLALILIHGLGLSAQRASQWIRASERSILSSAGAAADAFLYRLGQVGFNPGEIVSASDVGILDVGNLLQVIFARRAPLAESPLGEIRAAAQRIEARINREKQSSREIHLRRQIALGISTLLLVLAAFRITSQVQPDITPDIPPPHPAATYPALRAGPFRRDNDRDASPSQTSIPALPPLTPQSSPKDILRRMSVSAKLWDSLWADARITYYGPPGYFGPPQVYRNQVWLRAQGPGLYLTGADAGRPEALFVSSPGDKSGQNFLSGLYYPGQSSMDSTMFSLPHLANLDLDANQYLKGFYLTDLIFPDPGRLANGGISVVGKESIAGREAIGIIWAPKTSSGLVSASIDARTGIILRWRQFHPRQAAVVSYEITLTGLDLNLSIPDQFFNLQQYQNMSLRWDSIREPGGQTDQPFHFITDLSDNRYPPPVRMHPPAVFDLAGSSLTFAWQSDPDRPDAASSRVDVFASPYYLGQVDMGNPWTLACTRSPDGGLLAYTSTDSGIPSSPVNRLHWIRLADPEQIHTASSQESPGNFAFSPDSRYLAYPGCQGGMGCGVFILDTGSGETRRLVDVPLAASLAWSPDGKSLAIVAPAPVSQRLPTLFVVDARSGAFTYAVPYQPDHPDRMPGAPIDLWGIDYPPRPGGIASCARAPAGS